MDPDSPEISEIQDVGVTEKPMEAHRKHTPSRSDLLAWQRFIRADSHILRESPRLVFQQAANQPESSAPSRDAAARAAEGKVSSPWLRWVNKPRAPDPCLLTVGGQEGRVSCGAFLPGGARLLAAADSELQVWDIESGVLERRIPMLGEGIRSCFRALDGESVVFVGSRGLIVFDCLRLSERFRAAEESGGGRWMISSDGRRAACVYQDPPRVKLWDLEGRRLVLEKSGETDPRRPVAFCENGRRVVIHWRKSLDLVDSESGSLVAELEGGAYAAGNQLVVSVTGGDTLTLWDAATGDRLKTIPTGRAVHRCSIAPGTIRILADIVTEEVLDKVVWAHQLWDAESGNLVATLPSGYGDYVPVLLEKQVGSAAPVSLPGHAFWPGGKSLATWPPGSTHVTVWSADTGERLRDLKPHPDRVLSCEVSSSGEYLAAVCQDGSLVVWNGRDFTPRGTLRGNARQIIDVCYSPDERHLASVTADRTLRVWEMPSSPDNEASSHQGRVTVCAFSARGDTLLSGAMDGVLMLRDPDSGERIDGLDTHQAGNLAGALSPAGDQVAFITGFPYASAQVWNQKTGAVGSLGDVGHGEQGSHCLFSADGRHFVAVGGCRHGVSVHTGEIAVWRTDPWSKVFGRSYGAPVARFDTSPDGRWALFNLQDGTFLQWDFQGGPGAAMKEMRGVEAFAVHPSGQAVLLTRRGSGPQIMHLETQAMWGVSIPAESLGSWRAFSPDGMRVASWPCKVAKIHPLSGNLDLAWEAASEYFLRFSADGKHVATCTGVEAVVLRRADDGSPVCKYYPRGAFNQIDFAPGGQKLAVGTMHGEVHLLCLEGLPAKPIPSPALKRTLARAPSARAAGRPSSGQSSPEIGQSPKRIGRNDPCPCGSGKKYQKCHGAR